MRSPKVRTRDAAENKYLKLNYLVDDILKIMVKKSHLFILRSVYLVKKVSFILRMIYLIKKFPADVSRGTRGLCERLA